MRNQRISMACVAMVFVLSVGCGRLSAAEKPAGDGGSVLLSGDTEAAGDKEKELSAGEAGSETEGAKEETICVDICGAVVQPGVYTLPAGSRVMDAVDAAEGLTPEADRRRLNQARVLTDGEQIIVYAIGEETLPAAAAGMTAENDGGININTADLTELQTLSGIGEAKARAIVEDREKNGAFRDTEDIMRVAGIGEGLFDRIREKITV